MICSRNRVSPFALSELTKAMQQPCEVIRSLSQPRTVRRTLAPQGPRRREFTPKLIWNLFVFASDKPRINLGQTTKKERKKPFKSFVQKSELVKLT